MEAEAEAEVESRAVSNEPCVPCQPYEKHSLLLCASLLSLLRPSFFCPLPSASLSAALRTSRGTNTDTRARCWVGVSISSSTATARSAYDNPGAPSGTRSSPRRWRPVHGASWSSPPPGVSITQSTSLPPASRRRRNPAVWASANGRISGGNADGSSITGRPFAPRRSANSPTVTSRRTPAPASPASNASAALTKKSGSSASNPCSGPLNGDTACTAATAPPATSRTEPASVTSPRTTETPGAARSGYRAGSRTTAVTSCPRPSASAVTARPARPPAPRTTIRLMPNSLVRQRCSPPDLHVRQQGPGYFNGTGASLGT